MRKTLGLIAALVFTQLSFPVHANTPAFATCMVDSLNGKERKILARWIYFSIAAHPEMQGFSNISSSTRDSTDQEVGKLVTRLLVEDCSNELVAAHKADPMAIERAFEIVGQVAMQEILNNRNVSDAAINYINYTDQNALNKLFTE